MPLYDYDCDECGTRFEQRRSYAQADDLAPCPDCGSLLTERALSVAAYLRGAPAPSGNTPSTTPPKKRHRSDCLCCR
ncbi:MAG: zinc ribbon domain-containing protein [Chloroflexota bacterium]|nr:zinc ribbon domain-containing protein [Chloroflexota bacterium]